MLYFHLNQGTQQYSPILQYLDFPWQANCQDSTVHTSK
jgi:hypothetical protein